MKDQMPTLIEVIENTLSSALYVTAHERAYKATFKKKDTAATQLVRDAHYWARQRENESSDIRWAMAQFARVESVS